MKVNDVSLTISAVREAQYPETDFPEIAFVGRSNVGKSSLINNIMQRKKIARTSSVPGKTQTLNFYLLNQSLYFVDVPGFGYAKVSKSDREKFSAMIESYLETRQQLRGVIQLVDSRHEPSDLDVSMYQYLHYYDIPTLVVATKIDKVKKNQWNKVESIQRKAMHLNEAADWLPFSAQDSTGSAEVWDWIENHIN
ncbi:ribosome biogenesis GTP-binding protein YihA/YsxC [Lacticaseibacillus pabuli]|uniref:Probable GTP-binding protein EngB n=1 Tax=Lacticaseibacillus pabuli TaxID=3025672 RepID=A0ABY7WRM3_9LACO|nr:ribosome biogenesis GTP-binding protein YihA/YsxC [Lacticaseibacillus sp. KACC 23028]WDF81621.1 ribosome biogenesis GTP-binding protein YihA/YsxC [Lacticaseibacillus sp. KACC 23028]